MYVILVCFFITFLISFSIGKGFISFTDKENNQNYSLFDAFYIGLSLVGVLLSFWSIFFPTNIFSLIILLITSIFIVFKNKECYKNYLLNVILKLKKEKLLLLILTLAIIISLLYSLPTPKLYDSYLYHINAIQWNEYFKATPGLANFHDRLGFNSTVFVLGAGFSFYDIYNQYIFIINSLAFFIFFSWILKKIFEIRNFKGIILLLFIYYFLNQYFNDISSPGSDILTNIIISYLFITLLINPEALKKKKLIFIILPLFCITLKLSTLPIILISVLATFYEKDYIKEIKTLFFCSLLFFVPWVTRNIILSGYVLYPVETIDIFNFDWKVPIDRVIETKKWIYSWARIPFKDYKEVLNMSFSEWFPIWWSNQLPLNRNILVLAIISPLLFTIVHFIFKTKYNLIHLVVLFTAYSNLLLWLFTAPDFRFLFSTILFLALLPFLKINIAFKNRFFQIIITLSIILFLIIEMKNSFIFFKSEYNYKNISSYIYLPNDPSDVKKTRKINFKDVTLINGNTKIIVKEPIPSHTQCFDVFPCSWYIDGNLKLRGNKIENGFKFGENLSTKN
jgi:hypothetical protein